MVQRAAKWHEFEKLVAHLHHGIAGNAEVKHNQRVLGRSGRKRQLDVTLSQVVAAYRTLIVLECKRYKRRVGIEKVDAFVSKLEDVGASHGIIVSNTGFDDGARAVAKRKGITLLTYREATEVDWQTVTSSQSWLILVLSRASPLSISIKLKDGSRQEPPSEAVLLGEADTPFCTAKELAHQIAEQTIGEPPSMVIYECGMVDPPLFVKIGDAIERVENMEVTMNVRVWEYTINLRLASGHVLVTDEDGERVIGEYTTESWDLHELLQSHQGRELTRSEAETPRPDRKVVLAHVPVSKLKRYMRLVVAAKHDLPVAPGAS